MAYRPEMTHPDSTTITSGKLPDTYVEQMSRSVVAIVLAVEIPIIVFFAVLIIATNGPVEVLALVMGVTLLTVLLIGLARVRVRLDHDRLRWAYIPFWKGSVPYDRITDVEVIKVCAMGDYLGWGPRHNMSSLGLIASSGPAVRIKRSGARDLVITCRDAETLAAAILERIANTPHDQPEN